ncbi:MAG: hypothetical protein KUL88_09955 [Rhizobium sp.]|nr:hypothetical protein [Rhizobium sp.]
MNFVKLSRNKLYPLPLLSKADGAAANFLLESGNLLQIGLANIARSEALLIRKGTIEAGFIHDGPLILWVFVIGPNIFECPFDARLLPRPRSIPTTTNDDQRLGIEIHLIDTWTMILKGLRYVTLAPGLSRRFLQSVQEQLADARDTNPILARYRRLPVSALPRLAGVEKCGL